MGRLNVKSKSSSKENKSQETYGVVILLMVVETAIKENELSSLSTSKKRERKKGKAHRTSKGDLKI